MQLLAVKEPRKTLSRSELHAALRRSHMVRAADPTPECGRLTAESRPPVPDAPNRASPGPGAPTVGAHGPPSPPSAPLAALASTRASPCGEPFGRSGGFSNRQAGERAGVTTPTRQDFALSPTTAPDRDTSVIEAQALDGRDSVGGAAGFARASACQQPALTGDGAGTGTAARAGAGGRRFGPRRCRARSVPPPSAPVHSGAPARPLPTTAPSATTGR
jgi:hypothetical protein